jgi:hypothetical protein
MTRYDRMLASAERVNDESACSDHVREAAAQPDHDCLAFCISLLDHGLKAWPADLVHKRTVSVSLLACIRFDFPSALE